MAISERHRLEWLWDRFYARIDNGGVCAYCGQDGNTLDHFVPLSKAHLYDTGHFLVDCCHHCNSILTNRVFENIDARMQYVHRRLSRKREMHCADWEDDEMEELEWTMQQSVRSALNKKERILLRLTWRNRDNPAYAELAAISLNHRDLGKNSVLPHAGNRTINASELRPLPSGEAIRRVLGIPETQKYRENAYTCKNCLKLFEPNSPLQKYCSTKCGSEAWRKKRR